MIVLQRRARIILAALILPACLAACDEVSNQFIARCKEVTNGSSQCSCAASTSSEMMGSEGFEVTTLVLSGQRGAAEAAAAKMGIGGTYAVMAKWSIVAVSAGRICNIVGLDRM